MEKRLFIIGLGPGDPELITVKGKRLLETSDAVIVPQSDKIGRSVAKEIALCYIPEHKLVMYYFPMSNDKEDLDRRYADLAQKINQLLEEGKTASYVTIGDPSIYSTSIYLKKKLMQYDIALSVVPAVSSFNAASCALGLSLCEQKENFGVYEIPETVEAMTELIYRHSSVVFMKVSKKLNALMDAIAAAGPQEAYLLSKIGLEEEKCYNLLKETPPPKAAYLSTVIVRR
jgi:precorrin-2/cobalt-factor-2 C20-methyltransferase